MKGPFKKAPVAVILPRKTEAGGRYDFFFFVDLRFARFADFFLVPFFLADFFVADFFLALFFFADFLAVAAPPLRPPFLDADLFDFLLRPEPLFSPPPLSLLTVAQALRLAVFLESPRSS
jgi:hypothetical protein